jgi:cytochrome c biogenesis protein CcdA
MSSSRSTERPLPVVARELIADVQSLVSQEISLAKAEVGEVAGKAAKAAALFAVAGVLGLYLLGFLLSLVARVLDIWLPTWAAWLIVVLFIMVLIAVLGVVGYRMLPKQMPGTAAKEEFTTTKVVVNERIVNLKGAFGQQSTAADPNEYDYNATGSTDHG